jgi:hypothetical protein
METMLRKWQPMDLKVFKILTSGPIRKHQILAILANQNPTILFKIRTRKGTGGRRVSWWN